eukprot:COSAG02_NODE_4668_length_5113_cov_5.806143_4_plen_170_part_00
MGDTFILGKVGRHDLHARPRTVRGRHFGQLTTVPLLDSDARVSIAHGHAVLCNLGSPAESTTQRALHVCNREQGPAGEAMISMQVSQTEQASIQAAFRLISSLSGMYAPLYFTNHYFNVDWTGWQVISYAFVGYALHTGKVVIYVRRPSMHARAFFFYAFARADHWLRT